MVESTSGNPVLARVVRDGIVESVHRGSFVVTGGDGSPQREAGDTRTPMYPRSSNKPLQALGMLRAGLEVGEADLALACASHSGEPGHAERVLNLLHRHGLDEADLACPADYPQHDPSRDEAARRGVGRRRATMNCSGKHAAMLVTCTQRGWPTEGYTHPEHPLQRTIAATIAELASEPIANTTVDGCGAPLLAITQTGLANAFSKLTTGADGPESRIAAAMRAHPWLIAGSGQEDTLLMLSVPGLLAKGGAEAVQAMALRDGTAITIKIDDGGKRALAPLAVALLRELGHDGASEASRAVLDGLADGARQVLGGGAPVGGIEVPATALAPHR